MAPPLAVAWSQAVDTEQALAELAAALSPVRPVLVLAFHAITHPAERVAAGLAAAFPGAATAGCSTMGEVGDGRFLRGGIAAMAFGPQCRAAVALIPDIRSWRFEQGAALVGRLCADLGIAPAELRADRHLFLTLLDGLSGFDELILTAIADLVPGVPLVGACAADDGRFEQTPVFLGGQVSSGAALLVLVEPGVPFRPFAIHHFHPTGAKVVVTRADPAHRRVGELNGWPAVEEYARLCGQPADTFTLHPDRILGQATQFGGGGRAGSFLRGVMTVRDQDLVLAGSVEEGEILDLMQAGDIVGSTAQGLSQVLEELDVGDEASLLLFSCGGRIAAAHREGVVEALGRAMAPVPAIGFSTYGEHFGSLLVNYTLTGVAFGMREGGTRT